MQRTGFELRALTALGAAGMLVLTACGNGGEEPASQDTETPGTEAAQETQAPAPEETEDAAAQTGSVAEFCAGDPEPEGDEERSTEAESVPGGESHEVPTPYFEQLEEDEDFVPASEEGPAENVPEPQIPALICEDSHEGMEAALSYALELEHYAELTRDGSLLEALATEDCHQCEPLTEFADTLGAQDMWLEAGPPQTEIHFWQLGEEPDTWGAFLETEWPEGTVYDAEGEVQSAEPATDTYALEFVFDDEDGHWRVDAMLEAAVGDDALDQMNGGAGADGEVPETMEDPQRPELPAEVEEDSAEGALAAVEHWLALLDYTAATGDEEPMEEILHPQGEGTHGIFDGFLEIHEEGGDVALMQMTELSAVEVYTADDQGEQLGLVHGQLDEAGWVITDSDGEVADVDEGMQGGPATFALIYSDDAGQWQLVSMGGESPEEFEDGTGVDLGEPELTR